MEGGLRRCCSEGGRSRGLFIETASRCILPFITFFIILFHMHRQHHKDVFQASMTARLTGTGAAVNIVGWKVDQMTTR